ncbi:unnamed protein product, partial [Didymodactylos carnosus]
TVMSKHSKEKRKKKHHHPRKKIERNRRSRTHSSSSPSSESRSSSHSADQDEYYEQSRETIPTGGKTMAQIEIEREKIRLEKKKQRALVKSIETPQEKRLRRLAKKMEKERRRKSELGWGEEHMGMNNTNNPFGDDKLLENFVWKKKLDRQGYTNLPVDQLNSMTRQRVEENKSELEKLKRQRLERERQKEETDKEKEFLQRLKEAEYYREWEKQEDSFHFNQVKLRSNIRISDGRAKPIDLLARYISEEDDQDLSVELHEPSTYLNGLTIRDLEDLLADIRVYTELETQSQRHYDKQYWFDITLITEDELQKLKKLQNLQNDVGDRREGINQAVLTDVNQTFKNKTHQQLEQLEQRIKTKIETEKQIDIGYWESLLAQLQAHMAHARLKDRHQLNLRKKLQQIKEEQGIFAVPQQPPSKPLFPSVVVESVRLKREQEDDDEKDEKERMDTDYQQQDDDKETICINDYELGNYSPQLLTQADLDLEQYIDDEMVDKDKLERQRQEVRKTGAIKPDVEDAFEKFARDMGSLTNDDTSINGVVPLDIQYLWSDKYRPRKPRFFNKVHTGYDWNQYNKKHYDTDNPPPKTVQGYKFNIFYPDLIDKAQTPSYDLVSKTVCEDNREFAILKFHAGPPYEDIAFKIVSKEWDYSYKHGFRCQFQNEHERQKEETDKEKEFLQRLKEAEYYREWEKQEDSVCQ